MEKYTLPAPALGEGLISVKFLSYLKKPGETVRQDDLIALVETDKATMEIESPVDGIMSEWLHETGTEVFVGDPLVHIQLKKIIKSVAETEAALETAFAKHQLSEEQQKLVKSLRKSQSIVIAATLTKEIDYKAIQDYRRELRKRGDLVPSITEVFGWAISQASIKHPAFRSSLIDDLHFYTYQSLNLGIAVSLPNDNLATVVLSEANNLSFVEFSALFRDKIEKVKNEQIGGGSAHVILSDLSAFNISGANPVLVHPAVATIALTKARNADAVTASMVFDHRLINGAGAGRFLQEIEDQIKKLTSASR